MAQTEYTTVDIVKGRVGAGNVSSDIQDSEITQWIQEASNFIDLCTKKIGNSWQATDALYPTVQQIVTDLSVIKLLLRMSGAGSGTTSGLSYRVGDFSVDKKNVDSSSTKEIAIYEKSAKNSLAELKDHLSVDKTTNFIGGSVIQGDPAPQTNFGSNAPQREE